MSLSPKYLWVDDLRDPAGFGCADFHWAKTVTEAVRILARGGVEVVSLDHDITHTMPSALPSLERGGDKDALNKLIDIPIACPETYATVAHYIAIMPHDKRPRQVIIHTANEAGSGDMHNILRGKVDELVRRRL